MSEATQSTAFERATEPILRLLTKEQAEALVAYRGDEALRERIDVLADKCTEGDLTPDERSEYEGYIRANNFIATLQARARRLLSKS
ncbi:MAG: hypothetical protein J5I93_26745 [Pirellulaceae bacterium]|nr:hypothetical protein [Pirellulaceae bacterium]